MFISRISVGFTASKRAVLLCSYQLQRIFDRTMSSQTPEQKLEAFGYAFNDAGQLRQINPEDKSLTDKPFKFDITDNPSKNQENYEAIGDLITEYVYKLLSDMGLHKIYVPSPETPDSVFVFGTKPNFENTKKLLILIHGSGVVRAGQWSRSLIINHSLDHGTQIPYIKRAIAEGYDVLVMNSNYNYRLVNGKSTAIKGHSTPEEHVITVWKHLIQPVFKTIECFAIIGHSFGGIATFALLNAFPVEIMNKCFAIGFTDSVHSARSLSSEMLEWCQLHARNYVTSKEPLGKKLKSRDNDIPLWSSGHTKHEFTSWACIDEMFPFLEAQRLNWLERIPELKYPAGDGSKSTY